MDVDDLKDLPEPSRTRAKALLTCRLCSKYFTDPRVLPCRHSFCRKCLQTVYDDLQANAKPVSRRVGSMPCPTCHQPIGVPLTGIRGFPIDTKIQRIKELVVTEITKNLSKKINSDGSQSSSTTKSKSQIDDDDDAHSTRSADDARRGNKKEDGRQRDHSYDFVSFSEKAGTGVGYKRNPAFPDFSKFARYFNHEGKPAEAKPFKSTLRADRHKVGYSNSFQHHRRRVPVRTKAYDDTSDLFCDSSSRYGSEPLISEDQDHGSRSREESRSSYGEGLGSGYQRSRSARPSTTRMFSPMNVEFDDVAESKEGEGLKEREKQEDSPPAFRRRPATSYGEKHTEKQDSGNENKSKRKPEDLFDKISADDKDGGGGRERPKPRRGLHVESEEQAELTPPTARRVSHSARVRTSALPTHRENITTESTESKGRSFRRAAKQTENEADHSPGSRETRKKSGVHFSDTDKNTARTSSADQTKYSAFGNKDEAKERKSSSANSKSQSDASHHREGSQQRTEKQTKSTPEPERSSTGRKARVVDFGDEKQAPAASSSYQSSRRKHDINVEADDEKQAPGSSTSYQSSHRRSNRHEADEKQAPGTSSSYPSSRSRSNVYNTDEKQAPGTSSSYQSSRSRSKVYNTDETQAPGTSSSYQSSHRRSNLYDADEKQAPGTSSSYQSSRHRRDEMNSDDKSESRTKSKEREQTQIPTFNSSQTSSSSHQQPHGSGDSHTRSSSRHSTENSFKESFDKTGENVKKCHVGSTAEDSKTNDSAESESTRARRRRDNKSERLLRREAEKGTGSQDLYGAEFELPNFDVPKRDRPYRTREQKRHDARRNFSNRIKEVFEEYAKFYCEEDQTSTGGDEGSGLKPSNGEQSSVVKVDGGNDTEKVGDVVKEDPEEKAGRNWEELISNARAKYSSERIDKAPIPKNEPICAEGVFSRWRLQKSEYGIPTSMAITSKGCVIVAEYGLGCVEFYDETGTLSHSMEGVKPFSLIVNNKDQVIVGDRRGKAVRIFDEYGGDVGHWDATEFNWICGMAAVPTSTASHLVIYDRERCKLGIYSPPGDLVREFQSSYGSKDSQLCMADFITMDSHGRVLVADSGNHCVKVFDSSTGAFLSKFGQRGDGDGCLDWPKGICVDSSDNIIVTDVHNKRVSMFSSDGRFVRHLVSGIINPYSVCYSEAARAIGLTQYSLDGTSQYDLYGLM